MLTSETDTEAIAHLVEEAYAGRPRRRRPRVAAPRRGRLRARRDAQGRGQPPRRRPPQRAARRGAQRRGELHRERRRPRSSPTPTGSCSSTRATSPTCRRPASSITGLDGHAARAPGDDHRLDARGRREGRLRALHAQGDPRAARRRSASRWPAGSRPTAGSTPPRSTASTRRFRRDHPGRARRLRHGLVRGARRARPRSRTGPGCRRGSRWAPSSATRRRRSTRTRSSSR